MTLVAATVPDPLITETVLRICAAHGSGTGAGAGAGDTAGAGWSEPLWRDLAGAGLTGVGIPEEAGGAGGAAVDAAELVRLSGYCAAPVPLAETVYVAGPALAAAGLTVPDGPLAVAPAVGELTAAPAGDRWAVSGTARGVAWARIAGHAVAVADGGAHGSVLVAVPLAGAKVRPGRNLAEEPRDTVVVAGEEAPGAVVGAEFVARSWELAGAGARALQIAGALERVLEMTVRHARDRVQFGRPIVRFQAVAHLVAQLGEAVAEARMAAETAAVVGCPDDAAIAKIIAGEAASRGTAMAHQVFGAMGTTRECDLHLFTRRLWSWRDEFGSERHWAERLGADLVERAPSGLWDAVTAVPSAVG